MDTTTTTTVNAGPEYWHAPVAAAEAPRNSFSEPERHEAHQPEHKAFEAHDFGEEETHRG